VKSPEERTTSSTPVKAPEVAIAIEAYRVREGVHKQQEKKIDCDVAIELITTRSDREVAIDYLKSSF